MAAVPRCRAATYIEVTAYTNAACSAVGSTTVAVAKLEHLEGKAPAASMVGCGDSTGLLGSMVLVPSGDDDEEVAFRIVTGLRKNAEDCVAPGYEGCIVARRSLRYVPNEGVSVRVFMDASCENTPCGALETCVAGRCVPARCAESPDLCSTGSAGTVPAIDASTPRSDAMADGAVTDAPVTDASTDGGTIVTDAASTPACPVMCTGGCASGKCVIACGGQCKDKTVVCPPGRECVVECAKKDACKNAVVVCPSSGKCTVNCSAKDSCGGDTEVDCGTSACRLSCGPEQDSCNKVAIKAQSAPSFCLACNGNPGCNSMTCTVNAATCSAACAAGACNSIGGCEACTNVASCPPL